MAKLGGPYKILKMLAELWEQAKIFFGMIEKKKHEKTQDEIKDKTDVVGSPDATEEEKDDATQELEDIINKRS